MANRNKKRKKEVLPEEADPLTEKPFEGLDIEGRAGIQEETAETERAQPPEPVRERKRGEAVLRRERPEGGGKPAVVVGQFSNEPSEQELEDLSGALGKSVGCGAKVRDKEIWVMADRPKDVAGLLSREGFRVRGVTS